MKTRFRAITTEIFNIGNEYVVAVDKINKKTAKRMQSRVEKVTKKFRTHQPNFSISQGVGSPPGETVGPRYPNSRWAMSSTSNDVKFYYLEVGAKRYMRMSPDWQSLTRPGMGLRTFRRRGRAIGLRKTPVGVIAPRRFARAAAIEEQPRYEEEMNKVFTKDVKKKFFGRTSIH
jgi:hypothetical protein